MTADDGVSTADESSDMPLAGPLVGASAFGLLIGGLALVRLSDPADIAGGVLLLVAALALSAVALGGAAYGPEVEGRLDLSSRLGLGLLGGFIGAVVAIAAQWAIAAIGIPDLLGVVLPAVGDPADPVARLAVGAAWGLVFGVLVPWIPGAGILGRGAAFSLVPSALVLLVAYPLRAGYGLLGLERGGLTFIFVLLLNAAWGIVAAWVLAWGARTDLAPVSAPLGE